MIPFSAGFSAVSIVAGYAVTRTGTYRGIIWAAWALMILGWGLMTALDDHSNTYGSSFLLPNWLIFLGKGRRRCFIL
jgi:hypothetical protein